MNEADTCRTHVVPKAQSAGWDADPHSIAEQRTFTDGRIVVVGSKPRRNAGKRADYLLRYTRDFPIAVVEAKADYKQPGDGMQQAKDYAEILGLKFAFSTNGKAILEFDFLSGQERMVDVFPAPDELWARLREAAKLTVRPRRSSCSNRATRSSGRRRGTTRRSRSTARSRPSRRDSGGSC